MIARMRAWVFVLLVACGRVGFDPLTAGSGSSGEDGAAGSSSCPAACTSCDGGMCTIDVTFGGIGQVTCPAGMPCLVHCGVANSCKGIVDCGAATSCTIDCGGSSACNGTTFTCPQSCHFYCRGPGNCANDTINCPASCPLEDCTGMTGVGTALMCSPGTCPVHEPGVCP